MLAKVLQFLLLIVIMAAIPVVWWWAVSSGNLSAKTMILSTGASLLAFGICYKLMGTWDLIPDWIPFIGGMDDSVAWIVMLIGGAIAGLSFLF